MGRANLEQEHFDPGTFADLLDPYASSPLVTLDTTSTPTRRTMASLEGATGLQFGRWGVGLALGYQSSERRTVEAGLVRLLRAAAPAAVVGVTRGLGSLSLGVVGRWRHRTESLRLFERAAEGEVVELEGLREVTPIAIDAHYFRRTEETTWSVGLTAAGRIGAGEWSASLSRDQLHQGLTRQEVDHPAQDSWRTAGWSGSLAYKRPVGAAWDLTSVAGYASLQGTADLAQDTVGVIFDATERVLTWHTELRRNLGDGSWGAVFAADLRYEHRVRDALTIPIAATVTGLTTGFSVELSRAVSSRLALLGTLAAASYSANSAYPAPNTLGPTYRNWLLGEFDLGARKAKPWLLALGTAWRASPATSVWGLGQLERVAGDRIGPTGLGPLGSRHMLSVAAGVTLR
jgi:hypothetical protein